MGLLALAVSYRPNGSAMKPYTLCLALSLACATISDAEIRTWTNAEGQEITAEILGMEDGKVIFNLRGKEVPYPIKDLSKEDQDWLKQWEKDQKEKAAAEREEKLAAATKFEGVELQPGKKVTFELPVEKELAQKSADGGTPVEKTKVAIAVPQGFAPFDSSKKYKFLVINATSGGNGSSVGHMGGYVSAGVARDYVVFGVDHSDGKAANDNTAFRWSVQKNAMNYFHEKWPGSEEWPVMLAGFSGGAKWSGLLAGYYMSDGSRVSGVFMGGCNANLISGSLKEAKPKKVDFLKVPIWISNGTNDTMANVKYGESIKASMEKTGFKNVRLEPYEGTHRLSQDEVAKALDWFTGLVDQ